MIIDCISDLHGHYPKLEGGDLLIVAGDCLRDDSLQSTINFFVWMQRQQYKQRIYVSGNHDIEFEKRPPIDAPEGIYLCDSGTEFSYCIDRFPEQDEGILPSGKRTLKIWGSPWTKRFPDMNPKCMAFTVDTDEELAEKWEKIPEDIDILVTHCPPYGVLDTNESGENCGSISLRRHTENIMPEMVIFGHIHENCGKYVQEKGILYINGSIVDERYRVNNSGRRVMFEEKVQQMSKSNRINRFFCKE